VNLDLMFALTGFVLVLLTLPGTLTLATLSVAALLPGRQTPNAGRPEQGRLALLVPAHNESVSIRDTLHNLMPAACADGAAEVVVIADNCTDNTAALARAAGIQVIERSDTQLRGKGHALEYAFARIIEQGYSWVIVIDADTALEPGFLLAMRAAMQPDCNAVQACYLSRAGARLRSRVARLAQWGFNLVRPLGRARLGLSSGIFGNGFALRCSLLQRIPYTAHSVVEDLEYHLLLISAGEKVRFVPSAVVIGEIADTTEGARIQRTRWEGGRLRMLREQSLPLLAQALQGKKAAIEVLSDLLLLPLGMHVLLLVLAFACGTGGRLAWVPGMLAVFLYLAAILLRGPTSRADVTALLLSPLYLIWKLSLLPATLLHSRRSALWVRSTRNGEKLS